MNLERRAVGVVKRVTDFAGQIQGMRSWICQDMWVSDLAVSPAGFGGIEPEFSLSCSSGQRAVGYDI
jgi:hypothetical protein